MVACVRMCACVRLCVYVCMCLCVCMWVCVCVFARLNVCCYPARDVSRSARIQGKTCVSTPVCECDVFHVECLLFGDDDIFRSVINMWCTSRDVRLGKNICFFFFLFSSAGTIHKVELRQSLSSTEMTLKPRLTLRWNLTLSSTYWNRVFGILRREKEQCRVGNMPSRAFQTHLELK